VDPWPPEAHAAATPRDPPREWPRDPRLVARPGERVGLLAADDAGRDAAFADGGPFAAVEVLSPSGDLTESAARLFDALHRLDTSGLDRIAAQPVPEVGLGRAIMDRLRRATRAG
jgi:L-threonylcarbamoyladenylate synthase